MLVVSIIATITARSFYSHPEATEEKEAGVFGIPGDGELARAILERRECVGV